MPDITMCCNEKCNQKTDCYRFMADPKDNPFIWKFEPDHDGYCDDKIKIEPWHKTIEFFGDCKSTEPGEGAAMTQEILQHWVIKETK